jgi:DNA polymerase-3 subunit delta
MPEQTYSQVFQQLASKDAKGSALSPVYLVQGSDDVLKREIVDRLRTLALDPEFADFDYNSIDLGPAGSDAEGAADPVMKVLSAVGTAPFMSARRVVLATSIQRLTAERQAALGQGIASLGSLSLLILVADAPEIEAGRPKGRALEASFKRAVATHGVVVNCDMPQTGDLRARAQQLFDEWGLRADPAVCGAVAEYASTVSANAGSGAVAILTRECEKLRSYVGERTRVTMEDVSALVPSVAQENIFRLLDSIGTRSAKDALRQLDAILLAGDKPDGIAARTFVMLQRHIRMLILGKYASERRGRSSSDSSDLLTSELSSALNGQSYRVQSYGKQAANFTWDELSWASMRILASDMTMKGMIVPDCLEATSPVMSDEPAANLRQLVIELCIPQR